MSRNRNKQRNGNAGRGDAKGIPDRSAHAGRPDRAGTACDTLTAMGFTPEEVSDVAVRLRGETAGGSGVEPLLTPEEKTKDSGFPQWMIDDLERSGIDPERARALGMPRQVYRNPGIRGETLRRRVPDTVPVS